MLCFLISVGSGCKFCLKWKKWKKVSLLSTADEPKCFKAATVLSFFRTQPVYIRTGHFLLLFPQTEFEVRDLLSST